MQVIFIDSSSLMDQVLEPVHLVEVHLEVLVVEVDSPSILDKLLIYIAFFYIINNLN